jgi:transposase
LFLRQCRVRENDGRRLDHQTLEAMRLRAVDAVESGVHPEDVAASLGMGRGTVYGWLAKYREGGREALRARPVPGRPPKLSGAQMRRLYTLIAGTDPRQLEFGFALWTRELVRELIRREFRVSLSAVSVGRLLRTLGLSPQRPLWRAWQADPDAVQRWKTEEFPAIRAQAKADGATIYFADEAGIRSDYHAGTTWAPVGRTPVVKATGARHSLNMISAVTAQGLLRFSTYTGSFTGARFIEFCHKLLADTDRPVYLVVDGHPTHRSKLVKQFVASTDGALRLFVLPAYSPQLNPDEWVWKNVKHDRVGRTSVKNADEFKAKIIGALRRLQNMPYIIRAFFADPDLRYITAQI